MGDARGYRGKAKNDQQVFVGKQKGLAEWKCGCGTERNFGNRMFCRDCGRPAPRSVRSKAEASAGSTATRTRTVVVQSPGPSGKRGVSWADVVKGPAKTDLEKQLAALTKKISVLEKAKSAPAGEQLPAAAGASDGASDAKPAVAPLPANVRYQQQQQKCNKKHSELERAKTASTRAQESVLEAQERSKKALERVGTLEAEFASLQAELSTVTREAVPGYFCLRSQLKAMFTIEQLPNLPKTAAAIEQLLSGFVTQWEAVEANSKLEAAELPPAPSQEGGEKPPSDASMAAGETEAGAGPAATEPLDTEEDAAAFSEELSKADPKRKLELMADYRAKRRRTAP